MNALTKRKASTDFTPPLSVHFLIHNKYEHLKEVRKYLYKLLCRDSDNISYDGLDIPVYFHVGSEDITNFPKIEKIKSDKHVVIPLIDDLMFCDRFLIDYIDTIHNTYPQYLFPIALSDYAFDMDEVLGRMQIIRLTTHSILDNKLEFQIKLFEILNRLLSPQLDSKLKLFISHSKKDKDRIGERIAEGLRNYIYAKTKLAGFFDANDILDGQNFDEVIIDHVRTSLFVLIHSDTYSDREWCRKEIIECKYSGVPAIRVDAFSQKCNRLFPYMANIPSIRFNENWPEIVNLMLRTALDWKYQDAYLKKLSDSFGFDESIVEPTIPELISIHCRHKNDNLILYPEPPLGLEELDILTKSFDEKSFVTPMQLLTTKIDLKGKKIAISISEPTVTENNIIGAESLNDLAIEIARHLLASKAQLVYGGDLRNNGFTTQLAELSYQYFKDLHEDGECVSFHNFFAWPIFNGISRKDQLFLKKNRVQVHHGEIPEDVPDEKKHLFIAPNDLQNKVLWSKSLSLMRQKLENFADALIVIGGKTKDFKGKMPGIIEEVSIAMTMKKPIYIIGAAGGCGGILCDCILKNIAPHQAIKQYEIDSTLKDELEAQGIQLMDLNFFNSLSENGLKNLNNGLSDEDNRSLMSSTNLTEIVALILKGLKNHFSNL